MKTDEKEALRSKGLFVCKDARGSAEISNLACVHKDEDGRKGGLAQQGPF